MTNDMEAWLIDTGDEVIQKKSSMGMDALSHVERAIYCLWVVDYAVRNSGTLQPMVELYPKALVELQAFAASNGFSELGSLADGALEDAAFCANYYRHFEAASRDIRLAMARIN